MIQARCKQILLIVLLPLMISVQRVNAIDPRDCFALSGNPAAKELFKQYLEQEMDAVFVWQEKDGKTFLCLESYNPKIIEQIAEGQAFSAAVSPDRRALKKLRSVVRGMMATLPGVRYRVLVHIPNTLFDDQGKDPSPYHAAQLDIGDLLTTSRQDKDAARVLLYHIFAERIFMLTLTDSDKDPHEEALKKEAKFMSRLTGKDEGKQALHCYNKETGEFFMTFRSTQFRLHVTTGIFGLQNADIDTVRRIETDAEWLANLQDHECPAGWH